MSVGVADFGTVMMIIALDCAGSLSSETIVNGDDSARIGALPAQPASGSRAIVMVMASIKIRFTSDLRADSIVWRGSVRVNRSDNG
jgi:hypothetical protein